MNLYQFCFESTLISSGSLSLSQDRKKGLCDVVEGDISHPELKITSSRSCVV